MTGWILGGLGTLSANEYFGATLWQLYKGIDYPYKSLLKIFVARNLFLALSKHVFDFS